MGAGMEVIACEWLIGLSFVFRMSEMTTDKDKPHRNHDRKGLVSMNPTASISKFILTFGKRFYRSIEENSTHHFSPSRLCTISRRNQRQ